MLNNVEKNLIPMLTLLLSLGFLCSKEILAQVNDDGLRTAKYKKIALLNNSSKEIGKNLRYYSKQAPKSKQLAKVYRRVLSSGLIAPRAVRIAFNYYEKNADKKKLSKSYLAVADYTKIAKKERLHIINLKNGKVHSYFVSHGKRSGPAGGRVITTSNARKSHKTSKGFFKVGHYEGVTAKKGYKYLPIEGLGIANRKVGLPTREGGRDVVLHTASYVNRGGRSLGCFAIRPQDRRSVFNKIKGALLLSYTGNA